MEKETSKKSSSHRDSSERKSSSSSKESAKGHSSKSSIAVSLRNTFFFMLYRYASLVFVTSLITFISSVIFFISFVKQPVQPQYIPVNEDGTYITLLPVADCTSKTEAEVKKFMLNAVNKIYKHDYINYSEQFQDAANFFTTQGWNDYLDRYSSSGSLVGLKANKWIVTVAPLGLPEFTRAPVVEEGACNWELKLPISLSFIGNNSEVQRYEVYMRIERVSVLRNQEGLGIKRTILKPI